MSQRQKERRTYAPRSSDNRSFFLRVQSGEKHDNIADFRVALLAKFPGATEGLRVIRSIQLQMGTDFLLKYHFPEQARYVLMDLRSLFRVDYISDFEWHLLQYDQESRKGQHDLDWSPEEAYHKAKVQLKSHCHRGGKNKTAKQRNFGKDLRY